MSPDTSELSAVGGRKKKNEMEIMASFGIFFGVKKKKKKKCISTLNMGFNFDLYNL